MFRCHSSALRRRELEVSFMLGLFYAEHDDILGSHGDVCLLGSDTAWWWMLTDASDDRTTSIFKVDDRCRNRERTNPIKRSNLPLKQTL
jgi:hypothetical protein